MIRVLIPGVDVTCQLTMMGGTSRSWAEMFTKHNTLYLSLLPSSPFHVFKTRKTRINSHQLANQQVWDQFKCKNLFLILESFNWQKFLKNWHASIPAYVHALFKLKSPFSIQANLMLRGRQVLRYLVPENWVCLVSSGLSQPSWVQSLSNVQEVCWRH